jgi:peptidoglycan/xylan/chitin deacetylase (PgdA/CDA1 family)
MKRQLLGALTSGPIPRLFRPLMRDRAIVLILHRFRDDEGGHHGHDPEAMRRVLAYLRSEHYELISLRELFDRLREGRPVGGCVSFTIDDGHVDQVAVAGPIFAEFDCPVTLFLAVGFIDRQLWFWWDQLEYVFDATERPALHVELDGSTVRYEVSDRASRGRAHADFVGRCKAAPDDVRRQYIDALVEQAEIDIPQAPPDRYAPASWELIKSWEGRGMSFAPHSVTHPILARTDGARSRNEIVESWRRLQEMVAEPLPIFSYPNGLAGDFGEREYRFVEEAGLEGAVTGIPRFVTRDAFSAPDGHYQVARFGYPDDFTDLVQYVSGIERFKEVVRGGS